MAFNVGNFIKSAAKPALTKLIDNIVGNAVSGLPMNTRLVAISTATSLFNIGASYDSVAALASLKTDNIISGGANEYFALAGKAVNRTGGVSASKLRNISSESTSDYLQFINPETRITTKRNKDEFEVLSVL